jgi:hypothetical protein
MLLAAPFQSLGMTVAHTSVCVCVRAKLVRLTTTIGVGNRLEQKELDFLLIYILK